MDRRVFLGGMATALAIEARADGGVLSLLAEPGTHAIMRHALAPGTGDPAAFELRDCATQRNLDARGRAQAAATGQMIRDAGIRIDAVLSSQWCRCLDTARLLDLGPVIEEPALNSFFRDRARGRPQTDDLLARLAGTPAEETLLMVTHFVNVRALLGETARSGELVVFSLEPDRTVRVRASVLLPA